ncbi:MAG: HEAT repeat domain-containing protein [Desulfobacteraceae bacterium]|nr:HEAT repeat domain-containing protein [Desulfobacteraceae bacterium]MCF8094898.1 HEAT repeat domain-containing protein [Desulfobacteraceae bacterium]
MKRLVFAAAVLAGGLALSQALFTILVYVSNIKLYAELSALKAAGYLVIPNDRIIQYLDQLLPAFYGALFFTVTAGAGLSLAGFFAAWIKKRIFAKSRFFNALLAAAWLSAAAACNLDGWSLAVTLVFLLIPAAVFAATLNLMPSARQGDGYIRAAHVIVVVAAAIGWLPCLQPDVFLDIRDRVLLSNPAGRAVNEFYYAHTLYPAEIIKPPQARLINACRLENSGSNKLARRLSKKLIEFDYLPVSNYAGGGITLRAGPSGLEFAARNKVIFKTDLDAFFSHPGKTLKTFSQKADNNRFLRRFAFAGLITAFPLGLYIFLHAGLCIMLWFIKSIPARSATASIICLGLAAAFLTPFYGNPENPANIESIKASLESNDWYDQRSALKAIVRRNSGLLDFDLSRELSESPYVPVRYWLARALGESGNPADVETLKNMTEDRSPNVACMAYAGLGRCGDKRIAEFILGRIREIDHWYVQQYAYKAMRKLGWKQQLRYMNGNLLP